MTKNGLITEQHQIEAVIFDLDGTLLDTEALSDTAILDAFGDSLPRTSREKLDDPNRLPWELKRQILGLRGSEWIPIVIKYASKNWGVAVPNEDDLSAYINDFWKKWENRLNELCSNVQACPGAAIFVNELAKMGIPMAIATSSREVSVMKKRCRHESMFRHIPVIVTGDDPKVANGKPAPDIYIEACHRLDVKPCDCLVFEDALQGVLSGKRAGCRVIAIPDPRMETEVFTRDADADDILGSFWEFDGAARWGIDLRMANVFKKA